MVSSLPLAGPRTQCLRHTPRHPAFTPFRASVRHTAQRLRDGPRIAATADDAPSAAGEEGSALAAAFSRFVTVSGIAPPPAASAHPSPSPLLPPTSVVANSMEALQRNDWPEPDSGVTCAYTMTLPAQEGPDAGAGVRSWRAEEEWLGWSRFHALLHTGYGVMLNCDSWKVISPLVFPSSRHDNKAVQAVEVRGPRRKGGGGAAGPGGAGAAAEPPLRSYTFTFCLERVLDGPLKDCWMIAGVRSGNYALE